MKYLWIFILFLIGLTPVFPQETYPPAAGLEGSTAIHKDSSIIKGWASACTFHRGYINISDTTVEFNGSNKPAIGKDSSTFGKADGSVLSLGDGGYAILTFSQPIKNGEGADFAVFENGFEDAANPGNYFLELAYVEVSSDGNRFVRFPAISKTQVDSQLQAFGYVEATSIHNLAGKYAINYGVPFDLEDIKDSSGIDLEKITHIKIKDVVGSLIDDYVNYDSEGNKINDPWPTPFNSCGFDLDAVGVVHFNNSVGIPGKEQMSGPVVYPGFLKRGTNLNIQMPEELSLIKVSFINIAGIAVFTQEYTNSNEIRISIPSNIPSGICLIHIATPKHQWTKKVLIID